MDEIGGTEWLARLGARLEGRAIDPSLGLVVQHRIVGDEPVSWHVVAGAGRLAVHAGEHPEPDVTLTADRETAAAIAAGRRSAPREFLDGRLRIGGDIAALMAAREVLAPVT